MKYIHKNNVPIEFTQWKNDHPGLLYNDLYGSVKRTLKNSLISEQKRLCCYCECYIESSTSHIEHFKPKDSNGPYAHLQLDYNNLLASCGIKPESGINEHCGHKKSNDYNSNLVSPLEPDCSSHFTYKMNGEINGKDARGKNTINLLHLDSALLNEQRRNLIDFFLGLGDEEMDKEIAIHLDETGSQLKEFYTMIEYFKDRF